MLIFADLFHNITMYLIKKTINYAIIALMISLLIIPCFIYILNQMVTKFTTKSYKVGHLVIIYTMRSRTELLYCMDNWPILFIVLVFPLCFKIFYFKIWICVLFHTSFEILLCYSISLQNQLHVISFNFDKFFQIVSFSQHFCDCVFPDMQFWDSEKFHWNKNNC